MSRVKKYNSTTSELEYADGPAGQNFIKSETTGNLTVSDTQPSSPLESDVWIEPGGKIGTSDIANSAVTSGKIDFATFPKFSAYRTATQTVANGDTVVFTAEAYDVGSV